MDLIERHIAATERINAKVMEHGEALEETLKIIIKLQRRVLNLERVVLILTILLPLLIYVIVRLIV